MIRLDSSSDAVDETRSGSHSERGRFCGKSLGAGLLFMAACFVDIQGRVCVLCLVTIGLTEEIRDLMAFGAWGLPCSVVLLVLSLDGGSDEFPEFIPCCRWSSSIQFCCVQRI